MLLIIIACVLSSILLAGIGCVTVWYRYATYSDSIIHVLMLAGILGAIFDFPLSLCSCLVAVAFVLLADYLQKYFDDRALVLNVATVSLIAFGLVALDVLNLHVNLDAIFFGDILLVNQYEVGLLFALCIVVFVLIYKYFNTIVIGALNEEIAISKGANIMRFKFGILLVSAISVSMMVKIIGGLMITGLSIIPVFFARLVSVTPRKMFVNAVLFALFFSLIGVIMALIFDCPVAAMVTLTQVLALFLTLLAKKYIL